jgi:hypothetical protein
LTYLKKNVDYAHKKNEVFMCLEALTNVCCGCIKYTDEQPPKKYMFISGIACGILGALGNGYYVIHTGYENWDTYPDKTKSVFAGIMIWGLLTLGTTIGGSIIGCIAGRVKVCWDERRQYLPM